MNSSQDGRDSGFDWEPARSRPTANEVLASAGRAIRPAILEALSTLPEPVRPLVRPPTHSGLGPPGDDDVRATSRSDRADRNLHAALALAGAGAAGPSADRNQGIPAALAVELVHGFTTFHNVVDTDSSGQYRPATWITFGAPISVLTGDLLLNQALRVLLHTGESTTVELLVHALRDLLHGQSLAFGEPGSVTMTLDEYRTLVSSKVGALLGCACALGARLAGAPAALASHLDAYGRHVGIAFQCASDVLGIRGDPAGTGQPPGADLLARRRTFPIIATLSEPSAGARRLDEFLTRPGPVAGDEVAELADVIERSGGLAQARQEIEHQLSCALRCLERARPPLDAYDELVVLATYAGRRGDQHDAV